MIGKITGWNKHRQRLREYDSMTMTVDYAYTRKVHLEGMMILDGDILCCFSDKV